MYNPWENSAKQNVNHKRLWVISSWFEIWHKAVQLDQMPFPFRNGICADFKSGTAAIACAANSNAKGCWSYDGSNWNMVGSTQNDHFAGAISSFNGGAIIVGGYRDRRGSTEFFDESGKVFLIHFEKYIQMEPLIKLIKNLSRHSGKSKVKQQNSNNMTIFRLLKLVDSFGLSVSFWGRSKFSKVLLPIGYWWVSINFSQVVLNWVQKLAQRSTRWIIVSFGNDIRNRWPLQEVVIVLWKTVRIYLHSNSTMFWLLNHLYLRLNYKWYITHVTYKMWQNPLTSLFQERWYTLQEGLQTYQLKCGNTKVEVSISIPLLLIKPFICDHMQNSWWLIAIGKKSPL